MWDTFVGGCFLINAVFSLDQGALPGIAEVKSSSLLDAQVYDRLRALAEELGVQFAL